MSAFFSLSNFPVFVASVSRLLVSYCKLGAVILEDQCLHSTVSHHLSYSRVFIIPDPCFLADSFLLRLLGGELGELAALLGGELATSEISRG